jgi:hypothetical protein
LAAGGSHSHGNITNAGAIGSTPDLPIITTGSGVLTVGSFGISATTFCEGNDARLFDSRTPLSHSHGNITNAGAIGSSANLPIITTSSGVLTVGSFGTGAYTFCQGNDSRLSDARTPTAHASSHHTGGSDLVNHDSLTGFVAAEHYSHTAISMGTAATSGLNGGGTIAATRALVLAVDRLTAVTTLQTTDYFPFYDASGSGTRRISYANLLTELNGDLSTGIDMTNGSNNRVCTAVDSDTINAEANLTFSGTVLTLVGQLNFNDVNTQIGEDGSGNLTFNDAVTGLKTLADIKGDVTATTYTQYDLAVWDSTAKNLIDTSGKLTWDASTLQVSSDGTANLWENQIACLDNRTTYAEGTGAGITFQGYYSAVASTSGGFVRLSKANSTSGNYEYNLLLGARENGQSPTAEMMVTYKGVAIFNKLSVAEANVHTGNYPLYVSEDQSSSYMSYFYNTGDVAGAKGLWVRCGVASGVVDSFIDFSDGSQNFCGKIYSTDLTDISLVGSSDERLKTAFRPTHIDPTKILSMPIEDFKMKSQLGTKKEMFITGYVSQHIEKFYPEMVLYDKSEDVFMVDKMKLIPVIHRGWQLHKERFETHEKKIKRLERHIKYLENKLKKS